MEFSEWLRVELGPLTLFAGVLTGDRQAGHDVLADALVKALDRWDGISKMKHPGAYVRRIVVNTYLSEKRSARSRTTETAANPVVLDQVANDLADDVATRDEAAWLLAALPTNQRAAVVLRFYLDYDDATIAETLGNSVSTVRSSISRALASLRVSDHILDAELP